MKKQVKSGSNGYPIFKNLLNLTLSELLRNFGRDDVLSLTLFGSVARGEARPESDIDIFILYRGGEKDPVEKFTRMMIPIEEENLEYRRLRTRGIYAHISPVFMTREEVAEKPMILLDIIDHGKVLYDPQGELGRVMERMRYRLRKLGSKKIELPDGTWYWDLKPDWRPGEVIEVRL